MKYLYTALAFVAFGLVLVLADAWENSRKPDGVASVADYGALWASRVETVKQGLTGGGATVEAALVPPVGERSGLRQFLPQAPEGFARRDWRMEDLGQLPGFTGAAEEATLTSNFNGLSGPERLMTKVRNGTMYVYEAGNRVVELSAIVPKTAMARGMLVPGLAKDTNTSAFHAMDGMWSAKPWGVVQGVAWARVTHSGSPGQSQLAAWHLRARLGDIHLTFRASDTSEAEARKFLAALDIDGMNATLETPVPNVGSAAPKVSPELEQKYAAQLIEVQSTKDRGKVRSANERVQDTSSRIGEVLDKIGLGWGGKEDAEPEQAARAEVKINRLSSSGSARRTGGCGGTAFCSVGGD